MKKIFLLFTTLFLLFFGCDNKNKISESQSNSKNEVHEIKSIKEKHNNSIDSLNKEITDLNQNKKNVSTHLEYAYANIHHILSDSRFDHIIIGTENLEKSKTFFKDELGFLIKDGRKHSNGLTNFFIEFQDSSEIEIMSVHNPNDYLSKHYSTLLNTNNYGLQFSLRTNSIIELANSFEKVESEFSIFTENKSYSTLASKTFNKKTPFFIIKYNTEPNNKTKHENNTIGISAAWLSTPNIRQSVKQYSQFGFSLVDTISVADIKNKTAWMKNKNFDLILTESEKYSIIGCSILTNSITTLKKRFDSKTQFNTKIIESKRGKSIYLSPQVTKSIWFEFLEK